MLKLKLAAVVLLGAATTLWTGCNTQPNHPNQINTFDGASYDSLTLAHAALASLRTTVSTSYPQYVAEFNQAAAAYSMAYNAYSLFRIAPKSQTETALAISNLTVSIVSLENSFQSALHVEPAVVLQVRNRANHLRAAAAPRMTISDLLSELEIAATIAQAVPGTEPYSTLAAIVIKTTQDALAAASSAAGQPINLATIQPIPAIS